MKGMQFFLLIILLSGCSTKRDLSTNSIEALRHYHEGVQLWNQFYYAEAKAQFDSAIVADSAFAMAWARLALLNFDTRDESAARKNIRKALRLSTSAGELERLYIRSWSRHIEFSDVGAAAIADSIIRFFPWEAEAHVMRGGLFEREAMLDSAISHYRVAAMLDTNYAKAVMLLGYAYSTAGEVEKALDYMQRYIRLAPELADPKASYADLLLRVGRYDEALDQYRSSLELKPDYWYSITQIGVIYSIQGRLRDAEKHIDRGMALLPPNPQLEANRIAFLAGLDMLRGEYTRARERCREALVLDSTSLDAAFRFALASSKSGEYSDAAATIEQIGREIERRNMMESQIMVGFHTLKSRVAMEEGRLEDARIECEEALSRAQPIARGTVFRQFAEVSLREQNYEQALDEVGEALSDNPNSPDALLTLTRIYRATRDRRMMQEIGSRLLEFWKMADDDFKDLAELKSILGTHAL